MFYFRNIRRKKYKLKQKKIIALDFFPLNTNVATIDIFFCLLIDGLKTENTFRAAWLLLPTV